MDEEKHESAKDFDGKGTSRPVDQHEGRDISFRTVAFWAGVLVFSLLVVMAVCRWIMAPDYARQKDGADPVGIRMSKEPEGIQRFPEPRLQAADVVDMNQWRAREDQVLNHYGWADRNANVARVPIQRAMEMLLEKGVPARSGVHDSDLE